VIIGEEKWKMTHHPIDHSDTPIRLFKSDFLEFFSHISPVTVTVIWLPLAVHFLVRAVVDWTVPAFPWHVLLGFVLGLLLWTISEYLLHRFVFHFNAKGKTMQRIVYLFHGIHHHQPQCKTRLVMPPIVSIPLALVFYGLFSLIFSVILGAPQWIFPVFSAFIFGYLVYDLTHYATHHFAMRSGWWKYIKRYHMQHHYKTPEQRFGVSSPLWDFVFATHPKD
jgi:sterol desaturase/sphingolipid hydroxylase (fatty acid hydroxylase superfamily)